MSHPAEITDTACHNATCRPPSTTAEKGVGFPITRVVLLTLLAVIALYFARYTFRRLQGLETRSRNLQQQLEERSRHMERQLDSQGRQHEYLDQRVQASSQQQLGVNHRMGAHQTAMGGSVVQLHQSVDEVREQSQGLGERQVQLCETLFATLQRLQTAVADLERHSDQISNLQSRCQDLGAQQQQHHDDLSAEVEQIKSSRQNAITDFMLQQSKDIDELKSRCQDLGTQQLALHQLLSDHEDRDRASRESAADDLAQHTDQIGHLLGQFHTLNEQHVQFRAALFSQAERIRSSYCAQIVSDRLLNTGQHSLGESLSRQSDAITELGSRCQNLTRSMTELQEELAGPLRQTRFIESLRSSCEFLGECVVMLGELGQEQEKQLKSMKERLRLDESVDEREDGDLRC